MILPGRHWVLNSKPGNWVEWSQCLFSNLFLDFLQWKSIMLSIIDTMVLDLVIYIYVCVCVCVYPLEEGMATHSSILPGESLLTKGPSSLQSMGSQRVGHHWATFTRIVIASSALAVSSVISNPLLNSASEFKILVLSLFSPCTQWLLGS